MSLPGSINTDGGDVQLSARQPLSLTFDQLRDVVRPLDLIAIHGGSLGAKVIQKVEEIGFGTGEFTHVGVVVNTDIVEIKNGRQGEFYVWEAIPRPSGSLPRSAETGAHEDVPTFSSARYSFA
jgi:hypothetical protein